MVGSISNQATAASTDTLVDEQDTLEIDNEIENFLKTGGTFEFSHKGHNYKIVEENGNFVAYDAKGKVVDPNVQINTKNTVDGFIEVRGLYETEGNALYIGNDPNSNSKEVLFIEGDHNFNQSSLGKNAFLSTLMGKSVETAQEGNPVDFDSLVSNLNFDDAQEFKLDNDVSINIEELDLYVSRKFDIELSDDELKDLFNAIDSNGSGNIRESELTGYTSSKASEGSPDAASSPDTEQNEKKSAPADGNSADDTQRVTSGPSEAKSFETREVELTKIKKIVKDGDKDIEVQTSAVLSGPFVLAMNQNGDKSESSPEVVNARDKFYSFTTHDGFEVKTKYQKLEGDDITETDPDGANYAIIKFSSGGKDSTRTPDLERLGLDPADEGVTYRIVGADPDAKPGEDGYNGVYGSHDSAQLVIEIIDPNAKFTFGETGYSEGSVTFLKTDAEIEVLGGNYVDDEKRSDERYVPKNEEASMTVYHEDQGTFINRLENLEEVDPYGVYLGDDGAGNWVDNVTAFLDPTQLSEKGLHGNGSYLHIKFS
jgi:hypothetical protein